MNIKSHYLTTLDTRSYGDEIKAIINQPFGWYSAKFNLTGVNPLGFVGDEASVPRWPMLFWVFGGRGGWPAWPHDMLYRWPFEGIGRIMADQLFHDLHIAYHEHLISIGMRKEGLVRDVARKFSRTGMTAGVVVGGWLSYKSYPGCLDYYEAVRRKCLGKEYFCRPCKLYYPMWRECVRPGYHPTLWKEHMT